MGAVDSVAQVLRGGFSREILCRITVIMVDSCLLHRGAVTVFGGRREGGHYPTGPKSYYDEEDTSRIRVQRRGRVGIM